MFYEERLTIPANTPEDNPTTKYLEISPGVIHRVQVVFPTGCVGLVHVQVWYEEHQLYPSNPGGSFTGDGVLIEFRDFFEITQKPYRLKLVGWNLDDTYQHTPIIRIGILPKKYLLPIGAVEGVIRAIRSIFVE